MSEVNNYKVPVTQILKVSNHPNADRLDVCEVYGFSVITQKDKFKVGDKVVYIPINSVLKDPALEKKLFPEDSKMKLTKSRVRQIKLRGTVSQGMLISLDELTEFIPLIRFMNLETDLAKDLQIEKYEEKVVTQTVSKSGQGRKKLANEHFHSYNGILNIKWDTLKFEGKEVVIQTKIHGSHARAGILPFTPKTLFQKIKQYFKLTPELENVYGSNNVDITNAQSYTGFYGEDIYGKVFNKIKVFEKIKPYETIYGEIYGPGIQKNYSYGVNEHKFILFDVKVMNPVTKEHRWLDPEEVEVYAKERGFDMVPVLYKGMFDIETVKKLSTGADDLCPDQKVKEGVVVKLRKEYSKEGNKQALKAINEDYLADKNNTDFN